MSNIVSEHGLKPDKRNAQAIVEMPPPNDEPSLQRVLGMARYLLLNIANKCNIIEGLSRYLLCEKGKEYTANSAIAVKVLLSQDVTLILVRTLYRVVMDVFAQTVGICLGNPWAIRLLMTTVVFKFDPSVNCLS